ncbi:MAG: hypothetical protein U0325_00575 [Polyangiales bacterium]
MRLELRETPRWMGPLVAGISVSTLLLLVGGVVSLKQSGASDGAVAMGAVGGLVVAMVLLVVVSGRLSAMRPLRFVLTAEGPSVVLVSPAGQRLGDARDGSLTVHRATWVDVVKQRVVNRPALVFVLRGQPVGGLVLGGRVAAEPAPALPTALPQARTRDAAEFQHCASLARG